MNFEEEIFDAALALPEAERKAYLDQACAGQPELRSSIEELVRSHEASGFMVAHTAMSAEDDLTESLRPLFEQPGEVIDRYRLLQQIGEGGFGIVWMADQLEPVKRRVALKIIKAGMDTREVIARFEAERQALAMMDHPNIAKVHDAGATDKGRPYFVMELVKGIPITQFCDEQQFGTRQRLKLFAEVCSAINHAHQKGVIHRDIKPSNVMVTLHGDKPVPKVIDFGIAKATEGRLTDKSFFTRFEQFLGTPAYMSPEQMSLSGLDVDTRSDIYALGILLYELLTGKPPFDTKTLLSAGYDEMRRIICEEEPPKPSSRLSTAAGKVRTSLAAARNITPEKLGRVVASDLDWIVMKAIEKDRARRYETANGLALDIQRFLNDEPVSASPPSAAYRFRKFARRNKAALSVSSLIAAVLVAATGVSLWQAKLARDAAAEAIQAKNEANARAATELAARQTSAAVANFLIKLFDSPNPERDGRNITVAEILIPAAKRLETDFATAPAARARLQSTLGWTLLQLGHAPEAIPVLEKARDYYLASFGLEHPDALESAHNVIVAYHDGNRRSEAVKMAEDLLPLMHKIFGLEHRSTITAMGNLAHYYYFAGQWEKALKLNEEVLPLQRKVRGLEDLHTLKTMNNLAVCYCHFHRHEEAIKLQEEALRLIRKVNPEHPDALDTMNDLALSYFKAGRRDEALRLREELVPLRRKVSGPGHQHTLGAINNLANSYGAAGRPDQALQLLEELLPISQKVDSPEHPNSIGIMLNVAKYHFELGHKEKALQIRKEALALCRQSLQQDHPLVLMAIDDLARSFFNSSGGLEEAIKLREELLPLSRKVNGLQHQETLGAMTNLAIYYGEAGRLPEAIALQEQSLAIKRRVLSPQHRYLFVAIGNLVSLYEKDGRKDDAIKLRAELEALEAASKK